MAGSLVNALGAAAATADAFSDRNTLRHMLRFEAALATAVAEAGLIPKPHAVTIVAACDVSLYDPAPLAEAARRTATWTVPVVKALTAEVAKRDKSAAEYVHWGATSQDVIDTAMVLQLGEALPPLLKAIEAIVDAFVAQARKHRTTLMLGRTLLQPATPLALGQKIAGWASDLDRAKRRLAESFAETQVVQFGGASGSLSALGGKAEAAMRVLAQELELPLPPAPWFTQRVRVAALAQDIALVCGALGKAARDISLMMQIEVGEAAEPSGPGRGGSSTMPHKRNPVGAALTQGGSFIAALGQLEKELTDSASLLGYSPQFVDRLLDSLKR
jgi:3-carboxy-cis,cis-muconate cycloisomerase